MPEVELIPCFLCKGYYPSSEVEEYDIKGLLFKKYVCKKCIDKIKNPETKENERKTEVKINKYSEGY